MISLRRRTARLLALLLSAVACAAEARAWSPETQKAIAADAARMAPPDLARQIERYRRELAQGAVEPFDDRDALRHAKNPDGSGALDRALVDETASTVAALRSFRTFSEIARRLGRVAHWAADLSNPLNASTADSEEARYFRDYLLYVDTARPRFAVVLYENRAAVDTAADVERLVREALERSRGLYPTIGREYRRIGFASGRGLFDDRSSAFGAAALAYSNAVTDAARLFRYVWLASGGADDRSILDRPRDRMLLVERAAP